MKVTKQERKHGKPKKNNPVAKNSFKFNKATVQKDRTKYQKNDKYKHILGEDDDV